MKMKTALLIVGLVVLGLPVSAITLNVTTNPEVIADGQVRCDRGSVEFGAPFFADGFESGDTMAWSGAVR